MSASRFSGTADELLVAILQAHLLAHLGVDGLGHLHGRLQDCKLTLHIKFERALDISLIVRLAFDVPSHDARSSALFLASSARSSLGLKLLNARVICGSSRDVTKSLSHGGS